MNVFSVANLPICGPFTVTDAATGETLFAYTGGPGDIPPEAASWPVLSISACPEGIRIATREETITTAEELRRIREEHFRSQAAPPIPGTRKLY